MKELTLSLDASTSATGWAVYDGPDLLDSGVVKPKGTFLERALQMANKLKAIQSRLILKYNKPFKEIVIEQNNVGGGNQQTMVKIGIATGIIISRLIADRVYFVNVRTWRKHFAIKGKGRQILKQQAIDIVANKFNKDVKDDEADAILIGLYFEKMYSFRDGLENHRLGI